MLWFVLALMSMLAIAFTVWPLLKDLPRQSLTTGLSIVAVALGSAAMYWNVGSPDLPSGASESPDVDSMVGSLKERLADRPDDINGWKMLGRSQMTLGNYAEAAKAYEQAMELESAGNAETLVNLGEALLASSGQQMSARTISLFENALAMDANNPSALFWGGLGAFNRGDTSLAADRWELLLGTNPPPEVRGILQQRIAVWRGEPATTPTPQAASGGVVTANVQISTDAAAALPAEATVFIIARDPSQPSPPIAVTRRLLSELPTVIELGDKDSMLPGRSLSGFEEFELLARVSVSGNPAAAPGDWFGSELVRPAESDELKITISERVE